MLSSWAPSVRVVTDVVTTICSSLSLAQDLSQVLDGQKANKRPSTSAATSVTAGAALTLIALDNLTGAAAVGTHGERGSSQDPIPVHNSETLSRIGQDENYPANAYYLQNDSFSHKIKKPGALFSGHYDGGCHTISGLEDCLFSEIGRHGVVRNLRLDNINVNITIDYGLKDHGVLACIMSPASAPPVSPCGSVWLPIEVNNEETINSIGRSANYPSDAHYVQTSELDGARLDGNSSLVFDGHYDGRNHIIRNQHTCLFDTLRGTVRNLQLTDARITAYGKDAAVVACKMDDGGMVEDIWIGNSSVTTRGPALAGLVSARRTGELNWVSRIEIHNSSVETHADGTLAGAVAGQCHGVTEQVDVHHTRVKTHGAGAHAALGGGTVRGKLTSFAATCSRVETNGPRARAGMGAGVLLADGLIEDATVVNGSVHTTEDGSDAGVGAGQIEENSELRKINALYTKLHTAGKSASAGVGAGSLVKSNIVAHVTGFESEVATTGAQSDAGVGVGIIDTNSDRYRLMYLASAYNVIKTTANSSRASMTGNLAAGGSAIDPYPITVDTFINSVFKNDSVTQYTLDTFCDYVDRRLVARDCHINRTALPGNCAPIQFATPLNLTTPSAVCNFYEPAEVTVRPSVSTSSPGNQTLVPVSVPPLTVTASVPLVTGLSTATTAGIAVAATVFVIGAGIAACCCYRSRCHTEKPKKEEEESSYLWDL